MQGVENDMAALDLSVPYSPVALYLHDADSVEYIREDIPALYARVDAFLTLIYDLEDQSRLIGFRLKGFKHIYLTYLRDKFQKFGDFLALVSVFEQLVETVGDSVFEAYAQAREIAATDGVTLRDLPEAA